MDYDFFNDKEHLKQIANIFQKVKEGIYKKVSVSMPPRYGKSYITTLFCLWMLGLNAEGSIMRNSYSERLAEKFSYDVRSLLKSEQYLSIFPEIELAGDKQAVRGWNLSTAKQVSYFCAGVGGSITGFGCDLLSILDDPIKNYEEASSEVIIDKVWDWYGSTHRSRHESNCPEIHIATRWSDKDPIGQLKDANYFDKIIEIPALLNGKSTCEQIKSTEELLEIKSITDEIIFESVYQQQPIQAKGLLFPNNSLLRFRMSDLNQKPDAIIGVGDIADEGSDNLSLPIGYVYGTRVYITDVLFTTDPIEVTQPLAAQKIIDSGLNYVMFESNNGGKGFALKVSELIQGLCNTFVDWRATTQNKHSRILFASGIVKRDFYFRNDYQQGSDYDKFMKNLTSYMKKKGSKHDDAPDSMALMTEVMKETNNQFDLR